MLDSTSTLGIRVTAARVAAAGLAGVLAVSGLAAASAAAATPASASWRIVKRVHAGDLGQFTAVTALGSRGGWAFLGRNGVTAYKRSGSSWTKVPFPHKPGEYVVAAGALSSTDAWAFTASGVTTRAVRWNGRRWKAEHSFAYSLTGATVISAHNIWAFTESYVGGRGGSYHYNGHSWKHVSSGFGLTGGSASSADNVWAFDGTNVARWTGSTWKWTSVRHLLPKPGPGPYSLPAVVTMWAQSAHSVWAVGDGNYENQGGPVVVLHYNGHTWKKVASASRARKMGRGYSDGSISSDGHGGLWIPLIGGGAQDVCLLLHYTGGKLNLTKLPVPDSQIYLFAIAAIPGSHGGELAAGFTSSSSSSDVVGAILQYGG